MYLAFAQETNHHHVSFAILWKKYISALVGLQDGEGGSYGPLKSTTNYQGLTLIGLSWFDEIYNKDIEKETNNCNTSII